MLEHLFQVIKCIKRHMFLWAAAHFIRCIGWAPTHKSVCLLLTFISWKKSTRLLLISCHHRHLAGEMGSIENKQTSRQASKQTNKQRFNRDDCFALLVLNIVKNTSLFPTTPRKVITIFFNIWIQLVFLYRHSVLPVLSLTNLYSKSTPLARKVVAL